MIISAKFIIAVTTMFLAICMFCHLIVLINLDCTNRFRTVIELDAMTVFIPVVFEWENTATEKRSFGWTRTATIRFALID